MKAAPATRPPTFVQSAPIASREDAKRPTKRRKTRRSRLAVVRRFRIPLQSRPPSRCATSLRGRLERLIIVENARGRSRQARRSLARVYESALRLLRSCRRFALRGRPALLDIVQHHHRIPSHDAAEVILGLRSFPEGQRFTRPEPAPRTSTSGAPPRVRIDLRFGVDWPVSIARSATGQYRQAARSPPSDPSRPTSAEATFACEAARANGSKSRPSRTVGGFAIAAS